MNHQPLLLWAIAVAVLGSILAAGALTPPGLTSPSAESETSESAADFSQRIVALVSPPPVGTSPQERRAWLENVREKALAGAEIAASEEDMRAAELWSSVLAEISSYPVDEDSQPELSRATSRLTTAAYRLENHYRRR